MLNKINKCDSGLVNRLLKLKTVAKNLGISERGVYRLIARGILPPPIKIGRCSRLFESDVLALKERLKQDRKTVIHSLK
jgi:predicted DNA-binding transcriptional regulator AlpA